MVVLANHVAYSLSITMGTKRHAYSQQNHFSPLYLSSSVLQHRSLKLDNTPNAWNVREDFDDDADVAYLHHSPGGISNTDIQGQQCRTFGKHR